MVTVNFLACGQVGDLIHSLYTVKSICLRDDVKANIYISDISSQLPCCGNFTYDTVKTYDDLKEFIISLSYVNDFNILPPNFTESFINLNVWRDYIEVIKSHSGSYSKCWSELMIEKFEINKVDGPWIDSSVDPNTENKILIHQSHHRHNPNFNWDSVILPTEEYYFVTTNTREWDIFQHKRDNVKMYLVTTVSEMISAINGCKYFIGNQSSPFAIASALDKPRLGLLDNTSKGFYIDEKKYYNNISWFCDSVNKHMGINPLNLV